MHLYELALELGVRSADLSSRAVELGLGEVGPASALTAEQVAALRADVAPPPVAAAATAPATAAQAVGWAAPHATPAGGEGGRRTQWVAAAVLAPLVITLFVFMATNTGTEERPDRPADEAAAGEVPPAGTGADEAATTLPEIAGGIGDLPARGGSAPEGRGPAADPGTPGECQVAPAPALVGRPIVEDCGDVEAPPASSPGAPSRDPRGGPMPALPAHVPLDLPDFCRAAVRAFRFEQALAEAGAGDGGSAMGTVIVAGRADWRTAVDEMWAAGPLRLLPDLEHYRDRYATVLDRIGEATPEEEIQRSFDELFDDRLVLAAGRINEAARDSCT
ncbi:MAG TPA: hypothetical protein VHK88_15300 [Aquihabitans sp.]|nr:hypothetical protein [Aquihabitans sp.]